MDEYMRRLMLAIDNGVIDQGAIVHAQVFHDDWCGRKGEECNCDPDIIIQSTGSDGAQVRSTITKDGWLKVTN